MAKPQQPELRRSGLGSTDQDGKDLRADSTMPDEDDPIGPVPEANQAGHRPDSDQDKPDGPPGDRS
jgi:hypothetical protein